MKSYLKPFFFLYYYTLFFPLAISLMVVCAIMAMVFALLFGQRAGSYWGRIWAKGTCLLSFVRVIVTGKEYLSKEQSYVFVANHSSSYDIYSMYGYLGRDIRWMMKKELMRVPFLGPACKMVGHIAVDRSNALKAAETIEKAKKTLQNGTSVVFFPEGSRTRTGKMSAFKRGAFVTAQEIGLPVVPVAIEGTYNIMPPGTNIIRPGKVYLHIQPPYLLNSATKDEMLIHVNKVHDLIEVKLKGSLN
ncbi:MAG TPA: lysophospholipid acyltransferase family protein [Bacteroidales bacterium]|nr:lysophospholipid acyltransferase family protein [Bacteroidales bacterium]